MQFTEFLVGGHIKSMETLACLMPSFSSMVEEVGLAVPIAFQLVRPIVREALQCSSDPLSDKLPPYLAKWHPFGDAISSVLARVLPSALWTIVSPKLYVLFWCLSLYDIKMPTDRYAYEKKHLTTRYTDLQQKDTASLSGANGQQLTKELISKVPL